MLLCYFSDAAATGSYIKKIQFLLLYMFQHQQVFSKTDVTNDTVKFATQAFDMEDKNLFWTKQQLNLVNNDPKRVIFTSEFGTGKTTLLKAKAKNIARSKKNFENSKIMKEKSKKTEKKAKNQSITEDPGKTFFILFIKSETPLFETLQKEFEELKTHIELISFDTKCEKDLIELVKANSKCNFFLDEVLVSKMAISVTTIGTISIIISESNYLWIACQSDKLPNILDVNFRGKI